MPRGEPGEFCTRGYSVMQGYWDDAEKTAEAIDDDGWMHTGDLATHGRGGLRQHRRAPKDMVIRGGENIYPREIEEFLYRHPKMQDVQVIGVPDEVRRGALRVGRCTRASATPEEIREFCKGQIAHYKVPRYVEFVDDFPMTVTGKIQKFAMREETIGKLGLKAEKTASMRAPGRRGSTTRRAGPGAVQCEPGAQSLRRSGAAAGHRATPDCRDAG